MGAPKTPKKYEWEYNGRTSNKKGAGQIFVWMENNEFLKN